MKCIWCDREHEGKASSCDATYCLKSLKEELALFVRDNAALKARVAELEKLLESLTPGGSEFHGDPERCAEYVLDDRKTAMKAMYELARRANELEVGGEGMSTPSTYTPDVSKSDGEIDTLTCGNCVLRQDVSWAHRRCFYDKARVEYKDPCRFPDIAKAILAERGKR